MCNEQQDNGENGEMPNRLTQLPPQARRAAQTQTGPLFRHTIEWYEVPSYEDHPSLSPARVFGASDTLYDSLNIPVLARGGFLVTLPMQALCAYAWWRNFFTNLRACNYCMSLFMDPILLGLVLEMTVHPWTVTGYEANLTLGLIIGATDLAVFLDMIPVAEHLSRLFSRFIGIRIFARDPWHSSVSLDWIMYRSEELAGAFEYLLRHANPPTLRYNAHAVQILNLYWTIIPQEYWPMTTAHFSEDLADGLDGHAANALQDSENWFVSEVDHVVGTMLAGDVAINPEYPREGPLVIWTRPVPEATAAVELALRAIARRWFRDWMVRCVLVYIAWVESFGLAVADLE
ncbi:uncharacterized protein F5Z01DRAFT_750369 [Emericellopsis atlantica]|uniref:Uncharacterized protein n=1 Tax=Emericellopsis atlantica TaxID=2614577 RepID=A0A9P7ZM09_9HYPO|nr:uncharacterized protein F5Z01DRAFT_750369 [Emericellopsis atlantica]KAG9254485.1 hypothetical protein F5Z01DRAFT_750369 [Emericellopsis atlantica]